MPIKRLVDKQPQLIRIRRPYVYPQRTGFVGALLYMKGRNQKDTVFIILRHSLAFKLGKKPVNVTGNDFSSFFSKEEFEPAEFLNACSYEWRFHLQHGDFILRVLKSAGYGGNIDDLWQSVHNLRRPSKFVPAIHSESKTVARTGFVGALPFAKHRGKVETIAEILRICLLDRLKKDTLTDRDRVDFFRKQRIDVGEFEKASTKCWLENPDHAENMFYFLKLAGYGGTIGDLRQSVLNQPLQKSPKKIRIANTGQTGKPGSHHSGIF